MLWSYTWGLFCINALILALPLGPNLQVLGGVYLGPTSGMNL
jgi:hypothetical protein